MHRRAQLVAHVGEESALGAVSGFGGILGGGEFVGAGFDLAFQIRLVVAQLRLGGLAGSDVAEGRDRCAGGPPCIVEDRLTGDIGVQQCAGSGHELFLAGKRVTAADCDIDRALRQRQGVVAVCVRVEQVVADLAEHFVRRKAEQFAKGWIDQRDLALRVHDVDAVRDGVGDRLQALRLTGQRLLACGDLVGHLVETDGQCGDLVAAPERRDARVVVALGQALGADTQDFDPAQYIAIHEQSEHDEEHPEAGQVAQHTHAALVIQCGLVAFEWQLDAYYAAQLTFLVTVGLAVVLADAFRRIFFHAVALEAVALDPDRRGVEEPAFAGIVLDGFHALFGLRVRPEVCHRRQLELVGTVGWIARPVGHVVEDVAVVGPVLVVVGDAAHRVGRQETDGFIVEGQLVGKKRLLINPPCRHQHGVDGPDVSFLFGPMVPVDLAPGQAKVEQQYRAKYHA